MLNHQVIAYTDGGCKPNPGPGGWGVHIEYPDGRVVELGGAELVSTNNRMELRAAIEALRVTSPEPLVTIVTDSEYVRKGATSWLRGWKTNGWRTSEKTPVENQDLWQALDALLDNRITWEWVRGHEGVPGNERCDAIAAWFLSTVRPLGEAPPDPSRSCPVRLARTYLSVVRGIPMRHATWTECEQRTKNMPGAKFKKVRGPDDERQVLTNWGLPINVIESFHSSALPTQSP